MACEGGVVTFIAPGDVLPLHRPADSAGMKPLVPVGELDIEDVELILVSLLVLSELDQRNPLPAEIAHDRDRLSLLVQFFGLRLTTAARSTSDPSPGVERGAVADHDSTVTASDPSGAHDAQPAADSHSEAGSTSTVPLSP